MADLAEKPSTDASAAPVIVPCETCSLDCIRKGEKIEII